MTTPLFLVAHKAHGRATFDVAERMNCPECLGGPEATVCDECDGLGYWWITSTGGWRVYPWGWCAIDELCIDTSFGDEVSMVRLTDNFKPMPPSARELYNPLARDPSPQTPSTLLASLGLGKSKAEPIKRRV